MAYNEIVSREHSGGLYYVGIDAGSVSLNCVVINHNKEIVFEYPYKRHLGRVEETAAELIRDLYQRFGEKTIRSISFTGNHGKKLSEKLGTFYEFESISQVLGVLFIRTWRHRAPPNGDDDYNDCAYDNVEQHK